MKVPPGFERRLIIGRRILIGINALLAIVITVSTFYQPVPILFILLSGLLGVGYSGVTILVQEKVRAWDSRFSAFLVFGLFFLRDLTLPEEYSVLAWLLYGIGSAILGIALVMLPRFEKQSQLVLQRKQRDAVEVRCYREAGDSELMARTRLMAVKMGIIYPVFLLIGTIGLAGFGMYAAFTGDIWGLALFLMWAPAIALLLWLLRLRKQAGALREEARPA